MKTTNNLGLRKIELTDSPPDITVQDANWDLIDKHLNTAVKYQKAGGTGTAITLSEVTLEDGFQKTFIVTANNGSAATKINGKNLYKPGGTAAPSLIAGKAVTVWYDLTGDCFFIKASAEGDAVVADVLAGKKYSNDNDTGLVGTMPNNGSVGTKNLTTEGAEYTIPIGYHNGLGKVKAVITGFIASVIKAGTTVGGILGTFTSDANAVAGDMLSGKSGYVNGAKVSGNIIDRSTENWHMPASSAITTGAVDAYGAYLMPPKGYYNGESWVISPQPDLIPANILSGKSILGVAGGITNRDGAWHDPIIAVGYQGLVYVSPPQGFYAGSIDWETRGGVRLTEPNLLPANILSGKSIFGVSGTAVQGKKFASGTVPSSAGGADFFYANGASISSYYLEVSGLTFKPSVIVATGISINGAYTSLMVYTESGDAYVNPSVKAALFVSGNSNQQVQTFNGKAGAAYVNATGFKLPVSTLSNGYVWYAYE